MMLDNFAGKLNIADFPKTSVERSLDFNSNTAFTVFYDKDRIFILTKDFEGGYLKILDYYTLKEITAGINSPMHFNLIPAGRPFGVDNSQVILSASFADTIYKITEDNQIERLYYFRREDLTEIDVPNLVFSNQLSKKHPELVMPQGMLSIYDGLHFIADINRRAQVIVKPNEKEAISIYSKNIDYYIIYNSGYFLNIFDTDDEGYAYSAIYLTEEFYKEASKYCEEHDDHISTELEKLLKEYPKESGFENPVVVKAKLNADFLYSIFE